MEKIGDTKPKIQDTEYDFSNEFVPDSEMEDGLGRIVIEGPLYSNIERVNTNFSLNMMMCDYCPKYKVKESDVREVESVTYTYVGDLVESITGGLPDLPRSEDLDDAITTWLKDEDDVDDDADGDCLEAEDEG